MRIYSDKNPKIRQWSRMLASEQTEPDRFWTDNYRIIERMKAQGLIEEIVIRASYPYECPSVANLYFVEDDIYNAMPKHRNRVFAIMRKPIVEPVGRDRALILDHFLNYAEIGTLIRTALCFGFQEIVLTGDSVDPWNNECLRVTQDSILDIAVSSAGLRDTLRRVRAQGMSIVGIGQRGAVPVETFQPNGPTAVLVSGESYRRMDILALCDMLCSVDLDIPRDRHTQFAPSLLMYACRNLREETTC